MIGDVSRPLNLTVCLAMRYWPQLLLLAAFGYIARDLLMEAAVTAGLRNALAGMVILSLIVLVKLAVIVTMFSVLRPALPGITELSGGNASQAEPEKKGAAEGRLLAVTAAAILPFFVYYAAWGFLADTVREYSRVALARTPFGESANFLDLARSRWVFYSIAGIWLIRWMAKRLNDRVKVPYWRFLVVACDASWVFIGLYALSTFKDQLIEFFSSGSFLGGDEQSWGSLVSMAAAAGDFTPVELVERDFWSQAQSLFFFALLPLVWLVMAAIINGYEISGKPSREDRAAASRWRKWTGDFIGHFIAGYRSRYAPVWKCVRLTMSASIATLFTFVIAYQAISWLGAWAWVGATRLIGPHDLTTWQFLSSPITLFLGSPSDLDGGILLDVLRICLLAAVLDCALRGSTYSSRR
ncbi:hypothetical protein [Mesorhizobium sp. 1B3]|uniref:hypothetical protein n=1 Tax=Mesorhizobium sp. 1B3 TaxID=3243599 RepID=UPI003D99BE97